MKTMSELTIEQKAELFDYLSTRVSEMKLRFPFGGSDWVYNDGMKPGGLARVTQSAMDMENEINEED
jgi:hypothetical protein